MLPPTVAMFLICGDAVSDAACAMFGYTRETYEAALAGGSAVTFFPGRAQLRDDLYASLESGRITDLPRTPARRQDGSVFWLHGAVRMVRRADGGVSDLFLTGPTNVVCKGCITDENL